AHYNALKKASILHHDLSPGNIIIFLGWGLLINWDLSKLVDTVGPRQMTHMVHTVTLKTLSMINLTAVFEVYCQAHGKSC
ncbi:hypothetical protein F5141DRAFT_1012191, partial [Pisolithus sp. B1]